MMGLDPDDPMTEEEHQAARDYSAALKRGDREAAKKHIAKIRLLPGNLMAMKVTFGADYIRERGFKTDRADKHYGPGWLDREEQFP